MSAKRKKKRRRTTTTTTETASRTLFKTHLPDRPFYKKKQPGPPFFEKILGVRFPSILLFQASKHRRGAQPFFERSCTQSWTPPSQNGPNRTPPPTPPGLASLYTLLSPGLRLAFVKREREPISQSTHLRASSRLAKPMRITRLG